MTTLELPERIDSKSCAALKQTLDAAQADACQLDGGKVRSIDLIGGQLLLAFCLDGEARGKSRSWASVSVALRDSFERLGFAAHLDSSFGDLNTKGSAS